MFNTARKLEIFVIVSIIALIGIIYAFTKQPVSAPITENQPVNQNTAVNPNTSINPEVNPSPTPTRSQEVPTTTIVYPGQDGKTALELLKANHRVDTKHYSYGDMVTGIDGITPDSSHFWAFYINDQISQVGASSYVTKSSDTIKWQIDEISNQ